MSRIYVHLDFFHAAAFDPANANLFPDEKNALYVIAQPFLIDKMKSDDEVDTGSPALDPWGRKIESPRFEDYLGWTGATLDAEHVAIYGRQLHSVVNRLSKKRITPVPFPPGTRLVLSWNGGSLDRTIGVGPEVFVVDPQAQSAWPEFVFRNYVPVPIRDYGSLTADQKRQYLGWAYQLALGVRRILGFHPANPSPPQNDYTATAKAINDQFLQNAKDDWSGDEWRHFLEPKLPALLAWLWARVDDGTLWNLRDFVPPRFKYAPEVAQSTPPATLFGNRLFTTYHAFLWSGLAAALKQGGPDTPAPGFEHRAAKDLRNGLSRLYGFGERLRWPDTRADQRNHLMLVGQNDDDPESDDRKAKDRDGRTWLLTNAHSLLGQVFRITGLDPDQPIPSLGLALTIQGQPLTQDLDGVNDGPVKLWADVNAVRKAGTVFKSTIRQAKDGGTVFYLPKNAAARDSGFASPQAFDGYPTWAPAGLPAFAVPGALLDVLEPLARTETLAADEFHSRFGGTPPLLQLTPPRTLIDPVHELYNADPAWQTALWQKWSPLAHVKVKLTRVPLAQVTSPQQMYELAPAAPLHPVDEPLVRGWLDDVRAGRRRAALWMHEGGAGDIKAFDLAGKLSKSELLDEKGLLTALLPKMKKGDVEVPSSETVADLVFEVQGGREPFNWIIGQKDAPLLILGGHFTHHPSACTERLVADYLVDAALEKQPAGAVGPFVDHYRNFNKLRLWLTGPAGRLDLNHPDALIPTFASAAEMPQYTYRLVHQFAQEVKDEVDEEEHNHYALFQHASEAQELAGAIEHQYGQRARVSCATSVELPCATDVRDAASLVFATDDSTIVEHAFYFDHRGAGGEYLQLMLNRTFFAEALDTYKRGKPARLRALYELLGDMAAGSVELVLERWSFDNTVPGVNDDSSPAVPTLPPHFTWLESATYDLGADASFKGRVLSCVGPTLEKFVDNLGTALASDPDKLFWDEDHKESGLRISLAQNNPWKWSATLDRYPIHETTNAIRVGVRTTRPASRTIQGEHFERAEMKELAPDPGVDLPPLAPLAEAARADFAAYVEAGPLDPSKARSPLFQTFDWIQSRDLDRTAAENDRIAKLFGELAPILNFPYDELRRVADPLRLHYLLYDFAPLAGHAACGDVETTEEFAEYLLEILDDLVRGNPITQLELDGGTLSAKEAWDARQRALDILTQPAGGGTPVTQQLLDLIVRVDNVDLMTSDLEKQVNQLAAALLPESGPRETSPLGKALIDAFVADPGLYATSKAIAAGVFASWSTRLHSIQIKKHLRDDVEHSTKPSDDIDRFSFRQILDGPSRFFIDPLDLATYDDHFDLLPSQWSGGTLVQRGGAQARDAEDLIENKNELSSSDPGPALRLIEADVIPYNQSWLQSCKIEGRYFLPSRRFPVVPKPVVPVSSDPESPAWRTWFTLQLPESAGAHVRLADLFQQVRDQHLPDQVVIAGASGANLVCPSIGGSRKLIDDPENAGPFYHVEAFLAHYYFVIDADRGLANDCFEIEVQRQEKPFEAEPPQKPPAPVKTTSKLMPWFQYDRSRKQSQQKPPADAQPMKVGEMLDEIDGWLRDVAKQPKGDTTAKSLLLGRTEPESDDIRPQVRYWPEQAPATLERLPLDDVKDKASWVVSVERYSLPGSTSQILGVSVVAEPWFYTRVRVRHRRNVKHDDLKFGVSDFNPRLEMATRHSEWVSYGRQLIIMQREHLAPLPSRVRELQAQLTLSEWYTAADGKPRNFGPVHPANGEKLPSDDSSALELWNYASMGAPDVSAVGMVVQTFEDLHPREKRRGADGNPLPKTPIPARSDVIARQHLGRFPGSELARLTAAVDKTLVRTVTPEVRVTFLRDAEPLLQVTWPVRFR